MALKAGYKGVKKSFVDKLSALLSAKIIESIGNGLSLSEQGELAAEIDTETMEFKTGKLAAKIPSSGFTIEQIFYNEGNPTTPATEYSLTSGKHFDDYDAIILDIGQIGDGGVSGSTSSSTNQKVVWVHDPIFELTHRLSCGDFGSRSITITMDVENDKFSFTSTAENANYSMRIYAIQGIKF